MEMRTSYGVKPSEGNRSAGLSGLWWGGDNIETDLIQVWWVGLNQIHLPQDSDKWHNFVNAVMNMCVQQIAWSFLTTWKECQFLKKDSTAWSYLHFDALCDRDSILATDVTVDFAYGVFANVKSQGPW